jgi:hypothetical protein
MKINNNIILLFMIITKNNVVKNVTHILASRGVVCGPDDHHDIIVFVLKGGNVDDVPQTNTHTKKRERESDQYNTVPNHHIALNSLSYHDIMNSLLYVAAAARERFD